MAYTKIAKAFVDGSTYHSSYEFIKKDGTKVFGEIVAVSLEDQKQFSAYIVVSCNKKDKTQEVRTWFKKYCSHAVDLGIW